MPKFNVSAPDGTVYSVDAPDQASAIASAQAQHAPGNPYAVQHTGYAAQVARTMSGNGPSTAVPVPTGTQLMQDWGDVGKGALVGVPSGVIGMPGDLESLARQPLSLFGVSRETVLPTSTDVANDFFGAPTSGYESAGRLIGNMASPFAISQALKLASMPARLSALSAPFTQSGREQMAQDAIDKFAGGPLSSLDATQLVAGSQPTLAEASGNAGVAGLQRTLRDLNPNSPIVSRAADQTAARNAAYANLAGTPQDIDTATAARDAAGDPQRDAAFAGAGQANSAYVNRTINTILNSPAGQRDAVVKALTNAQGKLILDYPLSQRISDALPAVQADLNNPATGAARQAQLMEARRLLISAQRGYTPEDELVSGLNNLASQQKIYGSIDDALSTIKSGDTRFEDDPAQLYGIRQSLADSLKPLAQNTDAPAQLAAHEIGSVMDSLDNAIENAAPGYKDYMANFAQASRPIDVMQFLQKASPVDQMGNVTLAKMQNLLRNTGQLQQAPGVNAAKSITPDQLGQLQNIRDDLLRAQNVNQGRALGSNTVQNIASQTMLQNVLPGNVGAFVGNYIRPEVAGGAIGSAIGGLTGDMGATSAGAITGGGIGNVLSRVMAAKNAQVQNEIENILLNPSLYRGAANAGQAAGAAGNAGIMGVPAVANSPLLRTLIAQRLLSTLQSTPQNQNP